MQLKLFNQEKVLFDGEISKVKFMSEIGTCIIMPDHVPMLTMLKNNGQKQDITIEHAKGQEKFEAISGIAKITKNNIFIYIDEE